MSELICFWLALDITSFDKLLQLDAKMFVEQNQLNFKQRNSFIHKMNELRSKNLKLTRWLESKGLEKYVSGFYKLGYVDLDSVQNKMLRFEVKDVISYMDGSFADYQLLIEAVDSLKNSSQSWMIVSVLYFFFRVFMFLFKWLRKYHCSFHCYFLYYLVLILQTDAIILVVFLSSIALTFTWIHLLSFGSVTIQYSVYFASWQSIISPVSVWLLPGP